MNHGSNSWMMLSKRMTANNLDENPANHANASTVNTIKLLAPEGFSNFEEFDIAAGELVVATIIRTNQHQHTQNTPNNSTRENSISGEASRKHWRRVSWLSLFIIHHSGHQAGRCSWCQEVLRLLLQLPLIPVSSQDQPAGDH